MIWILAGAIAASIIALAFAMTLGRMTRDPGGHPVDAHADEVLAAEHFRPLGNVHVVRNGSLPADLLGDRERD